MIAQILSVTIGHRNDTQRHKCRGILENELTDPNRKNCQSGFDESTNTDN